MRRDVHDAGGADFWIIMVLWRRVTRGRRLDLLSHIILANVTGSSTNTYIFTRTLDGRTRVNIEVYRSLTSPAL